MIELYRLWCAKAKRAVMCWLWMSRSQRIIKDLRLLIADFIWDERAASSELKATRD